MSVWPLLKRQSPLQSQTGILRAGKESLRHLITCLLQGMTQGIQKIVNYKIKKVTQEENENAALFLGRLTEAFENFAETVKEEI